jgi:hypothetical protein
MQKKKKKEESKAQQKDSSCVYYWDINEDWRSGSGGGVPVLQVWSPDFNPSPTKTKQRKQAREKAVLMRRFG